MVRLCPILISAMVTSLALGFVGGPARADSVTAQSIWSKENAISRATGLLPAGTVITNTQCQTVEVRMDNERYICTLTYDKAPAGSAPTTAPSGPGTTTSPRS